MARLKQFDQLIETENQQLNKLNEIVVRSIEEEKLISKKIYDFEERHPKFSSRIADRIAGFGGSWIFIIIFFVFIVFWIVLNLTVIKKAFDPYPFILLNLLLSTLAALQAPIIMMSQNRKEEKDRQRAVNDYLVNVKSEIEVRNLHEKIDLLISEQMKTLFEIQQMQMKTMEQIRKSVLKQGINLKS